MWTEQLFSPSWVLGRWIRDHADSFLAAKAVRLIGATMVDKVEAEAVLIGMDFATELGYARIIVEGDSMSIQQKKFPMHQKILF